MAVSTPTFFTVRVAISTHSSRRVISGSVLRTISRERRVCHWVRKVRRTPPNSKKFSNKCKSKWKMRVKMIPQKWMSIMEKLCVISWDKWD